MQRYQTFTQNLLSVVYMKILKVLILCFEFIFCKNYFFSQNLLRGAIVSLLHFSVEDRGFDSRSDQAKDY